MATVVNRAEIRDKIGNWVEDMQVRLRVHVVRGARSDCEGGAENSIVSPVRRVQVDLPAEEELSRRKKRMLWVNTEGEGFSFWGRVVPEPPGSASLPGVRHFFKDRHGNPVTAYRLDLSSRTLHLFLDLPGVSPIFSDDALGLARRLAIRMIEEPVRAALRSGNGATVGEGVPARVREILSGPVRVEQRILGCELSLLRRVCSGAAAVPAAARHQMERISRRLAELGSAGEALGPLDRVVEREVAALRRLVESRSCSELRFSKCEIGGIANPAPEGGPRGRRAVQFLLVLRPSHPVHMLHVWSPPRRDGDIWSPTCLGAGERILTQMRGEEDLYGMLDAVLNYLATNKKGVLPEKEGESAAA